MFNKATVGKVLQGISRHLESSLVDQEVRRVDSLTRARAVQDVLMEYGMESVLHRMTAVCLNNAALVYSRTHGGLPGFESPDWNGLEVRAQSDYYVLNVGPDELMLDPNMESWGALLGLPMRISTVPLPLPSALATSFTSYLPSGAALVYQPVYLADQRCAVPTEAGVQAAVLQVIELIRPTLVEE